MISIFIFNLYVLTNSRWNRLNLKISEMKDSEEKKKKISIQICVDKICYRLVMIDSGTRNVSINS